MRALLFLLLFPITLYAREDPPCPRLEVAFSSEEEWAWGGWFHTVTTKVARGELVMVGASTVHPEPVVFARFLAFEQKWELGGTAPLFDNVDVYLAPSCAEKR